MPWVRLDDMMPMHPKLTGLSDPAFRLYICGICWSSLHCTDGHIPEDQFRYVAPTLRRPRTAADQLVLAGLWEKNGSGWLIHDYLEYQPSADRVRRDLIAKRKRQERWRARHGGAPRDASSDAPGGDAPSHPDLITSSVGPTGAGGRPDSPDEILISSTRQAIAERTGKLVTANQARLVASRIIGGEPVRNPVAYVVAAIMRDPNPARFLPTPTPPRAKREPRPDRSESYARGAEAARAALEKSRQPEQPDDEDEDES